MVRCGICGGLYYKKIWHSTDKYRKIIWQCNTKSKCKTPHVYEDEIKQVFIRAVNQMIAGEEKDRTTTLHTMVGTFYVYDFEGTLYVMKKA